MKRRKTSTIRGKKVIRDFRAMLNGTEEYKVLYMYKKIGEKYFLQPKSTGDIVRRYYNNSVITQEMIDYMRSIELEKNSERIKLFSSRFSFGNNESRLIIYYILLKLNRNCKNHEESNN